MPQCYCWHLYSCPTYVMRCSAGQSRALAQQMEWKPGSCFKHRCLTLCCCRCMSACFTSRSSSCRALLQAAQGIPVLQQRNERWRDETFALHGQQTTNLSRSNSNLPASNAAGPGMSAMQCFQASFLSQPLTHQ